MRSNLLVTKAWNSIEDSHSLVFVVDAAKRMSFEVKSAVVRLNKRKQSVNPHMNRLNDLIEDISFSDEAIMRELANSEEAMLIEGGLPCVLVMNKVDLVTNKRKMKAL